MADFSELSPGGLNFRLPCAICGRKFAVESLEKHQNICEKTANKKRKSFNSAKQRVAGADGPSWSATQVTAPPPPPRKINVATKKSSQGRKANSLLLEPLKLNQGIPVPSPITRGRLSGGDYVQCPTCDRNFSEKAADRHIQFCKEQKCRIPRSPPCYVAKDRLNARIQYKAPVPGKRRNSPPRVPNLNKLSSPYSMTSLNNLYLPSIPINRSPSVKVTGKAITAQRRSGDIKKPIGKANSHTGSAKYLARGLIPSDSWEWVNNSNNLPPTKNASQNRKDLNLNIKNKPVLKNGGKNDDEYNPFVSAQKQLEELMLSTCGSPTGEPTSPSNNFKNGNNNLNRSNRSSNWSLDSDKEAGEVEEDLVENLMIGIVPSVEDEYNLQLLNMSEGRPSRLARRTVSREEALFGTKNNSGSQDSDYGSLLMRRSPSSPARLSPSHRFVGNSFDHNNLCTSTSSSETSLPPLGRGDGKCSRFCHECGGKYPTIEAKFCCECGVKRYYAT